VSITNLLDNIRYVIYNLFAHYLNKQFLMISREQQIMQIKLKNLAPWISVQIQSKRSTRKSCLNGCKICINVSSAFFICL